MFAGIVVDKPIQPLDYGLVQVYGHCDKIWFSGAAGTSAMSGFDSTTLYSYGVLALQAATNAGYFETIVCAVTATEAITAGEMAARVSPVMLGTTCPDGKTTNTDVTQTTVWVKGFIRAM
jgi:hypothetical protein